MAGPFAKGEGIAALVVAQIPSEPKQSTASGSDGRRPLLISGALVHADDSAVADQAAPDERHDQGQHQTNHDVTERQNGQRDGADHDDHQLAKAPTHTHKVYSPPGACAMIRNRVLRYLTGTVAEFPRVQHWAGSIWRRRGEGRRPQQERSRK